MTCQLGRLGLLLAGKAHRMEIAATKERIEEPQHEVAMVQGCALRKAQAAVTPISTDILPEGKR